METTTALNKQLSLFFLFLFFASNIFAQERSIKASAVSDQIKHYVVKNYPTAASIRYSIEKENDTCFTECEFLMDKKEVSIKFLGTLPIEIENEVRFVELPKTQQEAILLYLRANYKRYRISDCQLVTWSNTQALELTVQHALFKRSELFFDAAGLIIQPVHLPKLPLPDSVN